VHVETIVSPCSYSRRDRRELEAAGGEIGRLATGLPASAAADYGRVPRDTARAKLAISPFCKRRNRSSPPGARGANVLAPACTTSERLARRQNTPAMDDREQHVRRDATRSLRAGGWRSPRQPARCVGIVRGSSHGRSRHALANRASYGPVSTRHAGPRRGHRCSVRILRSPRAPDRREGPTQGVLRDRLLGPVAGGVAPPLGEPCQWRQRDALHPRWWEGGLHLTFELAHEER
jgi:hypothetical protein